MNVTAAALLPLFALSSGCYLMHGRGGDDDAGVASPPDAGSMPSLDAGDPGLDAGTPPTDATVPGFDASRRTFVPTRGVMYPVCATGVPGVHIVMTRRPFDCGDSESLVRSLGLNLHPWPPTGGTRTYTSDPPRDDADGFVSLVPHVAFSAHVNVATLEDFVPGEGATVTWSLTGDGVTYAGGPMPLRWCGAPLPCD